ncbi:restriction endonuclease subunit S [Bacillus sp. R86525]|uniref:restriction endonuclease subunit S n=1 Tax=Bacillus sp. R86525 TaxID=3101709 RepID=UPI003670FCBD
MQYIKLKDVFTIQKGKKIEQISEYQKNSIRCIQIEDLRHNDMLKYCLPNEKNVVAEEEDILIAWDGANAGTVGAGLVGAVGSTLAKMTLKTDKLLAPFVAILLQSKFDYFQQTATGATIPHISRKALEDIDLPVIDIEIQKKIVKVINSSLDLIKKRQFQIAALDELKKSVFLEMFGDPVTNTKKFSHSKLGSVIDVIGGYAFKSKDFVAEGIPVIKIGTVNKGYFDSKTLAFLPAEFTDKYNKFFVYPKDLLITLTGTVGKDDYGNICEIPDEYSRYLLNQRVAKLEIRTNLSKEYLKYCFKNKKYKNQLTKLSRGVRQANISNDDIKSLDIPIPPLELQQEFEKFIIRVNKQEVLLKESLELLHDQYESLLSKVFKGELFQEQT